LDFKEVVLIKKLVVPTKGGFALQTSKNYSKASVIWDEPIVA
jgi:hypothetical protein